jgi:hypothetical protein
MNCWRDGPSNFASKTPSLAVLLSSSNRCRCRHSMTFGRAVGSTYFKMLANRLQTLARCITAHAITPATG